MKQETKSRVRTTGECLGGCQNEAPGGKELVALVSGVQVAPVCKSGEGDKFAAKGTSEPYEENGY